MKKLEIQGENTSERVEVKTLPTMEIIAEMVQDTARDLKEKAIELECEAPELTVKEFSEKVQIMEVDIADLVNIMAKLKAAAGDSEALVKKAIEQAREEGGEPLYHGA